MMLVVGGENAFGSAEDDHNRSDDHEDRSCKQ
jgi:hypothetical protein